MQQWIKAFTYEYKHFFVIVSQVKNIFLHTLSSSVNHANAFILNLNSIISFSRQNILQFQSIEYFYRKNKLFRMNFDKFISIENYPTFNARCMVRAEVIRSYIVGYKWKPFSTERK